MVIIKRFGLNRLVNKFMFGLDPDWKINVILNLFQDLFMRDSETSSE